MLLSRRTGLYFLLAAGFVAALAAVAEIARRQGGIGFMDAAGWRPIAWTLAADERPSGRVWRGHGLEVHVRPKLDYLPACDHEIDTDERLERASDLALLDKGFAPIEAGRRTRITDLFGRSRLYRVTLPDGTRRQAEAIAVSYGCHLLTALLVGTVIDDAKRKTGRQLLESNTVQVLVNQQFGSR